MKAFETMLTRYEDARIHCLRMANYHPDSREVCHQTLARVPTSTSTEVFLAGLLDDMALAMKQAIKEQEKPINQSAGCPCKTVWRGDFVDVTICGECAGGLVFPRQVTAIRQDGEPS